MKTSIAAVSAALLLAGCSTSLPWSSEDPIVTALQGQSADYVQSKLGLPNRRTDTRSGAMVWTYTDKQKGIAANECEVTLSIRNQKVESVVIQTDEKSLMSYVSSSCESIRDTLTKHS